MLNIRKHLNHVMQPFLSFELRIKVEASEKCGKGFSTNETRGIEFIYIRCYRAVFDLNSLES